MRRLRSRPRVHRLTTEQRFGRGIQWSRWIYIALLLALFGWIFDTLVGSYLYLDAEGLVTQERRSVAASNMATVDTVRIEEGQVVEARAPLVRIHSFEVLRQIASLSERLAKLEAEKARLVAASAVAERMLPVARQRTETIRELRENEDQALKRGLTSNRNLRELIKDEYEGRISYERMLAEQRSQRRERREIERLIGRLSATLEQLQTAYSDGMVRAPAAGRVANLTVNAGDVVKPGDALMDILTGRPYVLAYVQPGTLYQLHIGDAVRVQYGLSAVSGRISDILPLSSELPDEFQRTFRPRDRSQVIRIEFTEGPPPPTFTKVVIESGEPFLKRVLSLFRLLS